jgi:hypothetical protein
MGSSCAFSKRSLSTYSGIEREQMCLVRTLPFSDVKMIRRKQRTQNRLHWWGEG